LSVDAIAFVKTLDVDNPMSRLLLFIVGENTFNDSGLCRVGQAVLCDETRASERTVRNHIKKLAKAKVLAVHKQARAGGGRDVDAIELVGFTNWLKENRKSKPAKSAGSNRQNLPVQTGNLFAGSNRQLFAGSYKDNRTSNRTSETPLSPLDTRKVEFENGKLTLFNGLRQFWVDEFGGDEKRLDLALTQAAGYVQPNSSRPLEAQVSSQLAKIAAEKRDRDARYLAAAAANKPAKKKFQPSRW
jgi:hypothetical protein